MHTSTLPTAGVRSLTLSGEWDRDRDLDADRLLDLVPASSLDREWDRSRVLHGRGGSGAKRRGAWYPSGDLYNGS